MSRDSWGGMVGTPDTLNRSSYVENNPTTLVDPSGHFLPLLVGAAFVGALAGGAAYMGGVVVTNVLQDQSRGRGSISLI